MRRIPLSGTASDRATASLTFVGNATTLLRLNGCTLLTDPSFLHAGDRVHVGYGLFAKRLLEPALQPELLPAAGRGAALAPPRRSLGPARRALRSTTRCP